jgi:hypothetical protein
MLPSLLARPTALIAIHSVRSISYESAESIARLKRPARGGQNLTDRHRRLEKSLRGREAQLQQIEDLPGPSAGVKSQSPLKRSSLNTFRGFVVPEQPKPPSPDGTSYNFSSMVFRVLTLIRAECCMSGCAICVHDLYLDALSTYDESVLSLRSSLSALNIPESEWPSNIKSSGVESKKRSNVNIDAFVALERALREKNENNSGFS